MKQQTLLTLMDSVCRRQIVSIVLCFRRLHLHHKGLAKSAMTPSLGLRHMQLWADPPEFTDKILKPSFHGACLTTTAWRDLGVKANTDFISMPLLELEKDAPDDHQVVYTHVRLAFSCMRELCRYSVLACAPPWCFVRLLHGSRVEKEGPEEMRRLVEFVTSARVFTNDSQNSIRRSNN